MSRNLTLNAMLTSIRTLRWNLKFEWRVVGHVAKLRDIGGSIYRRRGVALFVDHKPDLLLVAENHHKKTAAIDSDSSGFCVASNVESARQAFAACVDLAARYGIAAHYGIAARNTLRPCVNA
jgi:hypothetical protein